MRVLLVSRPSDKVRVALSGGALAVVDTEDPHHLRLAGLALARELSDPSKHQRASLAPNCEAVALDGGPRFALLSADASGSGVVGVLATLAGRPPESRRLVAVATFQEFALEFGHAGKITLELLEDAGPAEALQ